MGEVVGLHTYKMTRYYDAEHSDSVAGKSWPQICGHLQHVEGDCETVIVIRERDDKVVLKYDKDGYDL
jgi:hypothetical protein